MLICSVKVGELLKRQGKHMLSTSFPFFVVRDEGEMKQGWIKEYDRNILWEKGRENKEWEKKRDQLTFYQDFLSIF